VNRPRIALSTDGTRAFAVWERYPPSSSRSLCRVVAGRSAAISGSTVSWGSVQQISDQGSCIEEPELAMSSSGGLVTVVWSKQVLPRCLLSDQGREPSRATLPPGAALPISRPQGSKQRMQSSQCQRMGRKQRRFGHEPG
jgi:hypothetical protein